MTRENNSFQDIMVKIQNFENKNYKHFGDNGKKCVERVVYLYDKST